MSENKTIVKKVCPCCEKHTVRDEKHKKALLNRLKRIEGQVRGIEAMIENDEYCNDVLNQIPRMAVTHLCRCQKVSDAQKQ